MAVITIASPAIVAPPDGPFYAERPASAPHWRLVTTIAFRFLFLYLLLYIVCTQTVGALLAHVPSANFGVWPPVSTSVMWVIRHVFHDTRTLAMLGGSGDKMSSPGALNYSAECCSSFRTRRCSGQRSRSRPQRKSSR